MLSRPWSHQTEPEWTERAGEVQKTWEIAQGAVQSAVMDSRAQFLGPESHKSSAPIIQPPEGTRGRSEVAQWSR